MTATHLPGDEGLDDRVPFLARLESADRSALLSLGHELSFTPARCSCTRASRPRTS